MRVDRSATQMICRRLLLLLALFGRADRSVETTGVKRTRPGHAVMSAYDPKRTSSQPLKQVPSDRSSQDCRLIGINSAASLLPCLLYTSDAADEEDSVDLGGRRII